MDIRGLADAFPTAEYIIMKHRRSNKACFGPDWVLRNSVKTAHSARERVETQQIAPISN